MEGSLLVLRLWFMELVGAGSRLPALQLLQSEITPRVQLLVSLRHGGASGGSDPDAEWTVGAPVARSPAPLHLTRCCCRGFVGVAQCGCCSSPFLSSSQLATVGQLAALTVLPGQADPGASLPVASSPSAVVPQLQAILFPTLPAQHRMQTLLERAVLYEQVGTCHWVQGGAALGLPRGACLRPAAIIHSFHFVCASPPPPNPPTPYVLIPVSNSPSP